MDKLQRMKAPIVLIECGRRARSAIPDQLLLLNATDDVCYTIFGESLEWARTHELGSVTKRQAARNRRGVSVDHVCGGG